MSNGMSESADESDLLCFSRPKMTLQQFKTHIILSRGARYDFIFNSSAHSQIVTTWFASESAFLPCCASFRNFLPLSPTGGMSRCVSLIQA